jgi:hypothetical protein
VGETQREDQAVPSEDLEAIDALGRHQNILAEILPMIRQTLSVEGGRILVKPAIQVFADQDKPDIYFVEESELGPVLRNYEPLRHGDHPCRSVHDGIAVCIMDPERISLFRIPFA